MTNAYQPTSDLVHEQVALYEATDGREGGTLEGRPVGRANSRDLVGATVISSWRKRATPM
jgi:hypothetical protein